LITTHVKYIYLLATICAWYVLHYLLGLLCSPSYAVRFEKQSSRCTTHSVAHLAQSVQFRISCAWKKKNHHTDNLIVVQRTAENPRQKYLNRTWIRNSFLARSENRETVKHVMAAAECSFYKQKRDRFVRIDSTYNTSDVRKTKRDIPKRCRFGCPTTTTDQTVFGPYKRTKRAIRSGSRRVQKCMARLDVCARVFFRLATRRNGYTVCRVIVLYNVA